MLTEIISAKRELVILAFNLLQHQMTVISTYY